MNLYGKKRALSRLADFRRSGRFPHALLFYGAKGVGKHVLADYTAMMYLCERKGEKPCMQCEACRAILAHEHFDVSYPIPMIEEEYDPKKGPSMVELLRKFIAKCSGKPVMGEVRVIVFEKLDKLSVQMQNTLLKFIEEPLDFNRYIFLAESRSQVLQTVLSRVTALDVDPADEIGLAAALEENDIPKDRAHELYDMFAGNIGAAIEYEKNGDELKYLSAALKACDAVADRNEYECLKAFSSLGQREEQFEAIGILSEILARAAVCKTGIKASGAYKERAERLASVYSLAAINAMHDEATRLYGMSFTNPNVKLFAAECCGALFAAAEKI